MHLTSITKCIYTWEVCKPFSASAWMQRVHSALCGWLAMISLQTSPSLNAAFLFSLQLGYTWLNIATQPSFHSCVQQNNSSFPSSSHFDLLTDDHPFLRKACLKPTNLKNWDQNYIFMSYIILEIKRSENKNNDLSFGEKNRPPKCWWKCFSATAKGIYCTQVHIRFRESSVATGYHVAGCHS